jgi:hypothetical protein
MTFEEAVREYEKCSNTKIGRLIANRELPILERAKQIIVEKVMNTRLGAMRALDDMFHQASDVPEMSLDEINAEIANVRATRKAENEKLIPNGTFD